MDWAVPLAAAVFGAVVGAFARPLAEAAIPPNIFARLAKRPSLSNNLCTRWESTWGQDKALSRPEFETVEITKQRGIRVWGKATQDFQGQERIWELEGLFVNGRHLQLMYYPSATSIQPDFSDFGCYLFVRQGNGEFVGMAVGEGPEPTGKDTLRADYCRMKRKH